MATTPVPSGRPACSYHAAIGGYEPSAKTDNVAVVGGRFQCSIGPTSETSSAGIATASESRQLRVVNSHRARMLLPGVADLETLRYFAGLVGEEETRDRTHTSGAGGTTRSTSRRRRPLIAPEALRQLPDKHALLLYGRIAPTRLRLRLWFEDRRLRTLARGAS